MSEIDNIIKNSNKAELLETLAEHLKSYDKAVVALVQDHSKGVFTVQLLLLNIMSDYEACGILEVAKYDILQDSLEV